MMEEEILSLRKAFGEELLRVAIEGQESRQPVEQVKCASCGEKMSNRGGKERARVGCGFQGQFATPITGHNFVNGPHSTAKPEPYWLQA